MLHVTGGFYGHSSFDERMSKFDIQPALLGYCQTETHTWFPFLTDGRVPSINMPPPLHPDVPDMISTNAKICINI